MRNAQDAAIKILGYSVFFGGLFAAGYVNGLMKGENPFLRLTICISIITMSGLISFFCVKLLLRRFR